MRKFFIIGCPRSGTTLLQQILDRHPAVVVPPETAFFTTLLSGWPGRYRRQRRRIEADLEIALPEVRRPRERAAQAELYEQMASAYLQRIERPAPVWFGDKTPDHLRHVAEISSVFPDARFILIYRDGRDVALSLSKVPWTPDDPVVNFGLWLDAMALQEKLERDPAVPILFVRYEDLVSSPEAEVARVTGHLELDYREQLLAPDSDPRGVPAWERDWKETAHQPIRGDRVGVWKRELTSAQIERMERWGGAALKRLGYPISPGVSPGGPLAAGLSTHLRRAAWRARVGAALLFGRR